MHELDDLKALTDVVAQFEADVRRLAWDLVGEVLTRELSCRSVPSEPRAPSSTNDARPSSMPNEGRVTAAEPSTASNERWTRERVVEELAAWLLSGTTFDAAFLRRHGPRGLVPAARRLFGRFDAALNHANLHLAQQYPEGPPSRRRLA